ncbi:HSP18 transcriptional regulator [Actinocrispum sp. NPDC049592]|uniref:HSP18 transcriptional regulator n=1 Tax=Actinocrispum sp. NPDC049592 TaxID=3154835 RepID=UPI00342E54D1
MDEYANAQRYLGEQGWSEGVSPAAQAMHLVQGVAEGGARPSAAELLAALVVLRELRDDLARWEPALIAAARELGTSWAAIAPALGLASRQAAERRYLRMNQSGRDGATGEERVREVRDRRAGDRVVTEWARQNAAVLRQLAGQVIGLPGPRPRKLAAALSQDDPAALLEPLAGLQARLRPEHPELADRIGAVTSQADQLRAATSAARARGTTDRR